MDWDEATTLGAEAAELIEGLTLIFEKISEGGYVVTPPTWLDVEEREVRPGHRISLNVIEMGRRFSIAKVFEPEAVDGLLEQVGYKVPAGHSVVGSVRVRHEFDAGLVPGERGEVPPEIGSGPQVVGPRWASVLDEHTCDACRRRHGMTRTESEVQSFSGCTNPYGCRCLVIDPAFHPPRPNSNKAGG